MCPIALGSDGGGSIRIPSAHCGLYGMKASMGRVPLYPGTKDERYPGVSSWESLEHIGPMSRTVRDAALMLSVIAGPDDRDRLSIPKVDFDWLEMAGRTDLKGCRVAYSPDWGYAAVDSEVRRVVGEAVRAFETDLGCVVEEAHPGFDDPYAAFWGLVALESDLTGLRALVAEHGHHMTPHLVEFITRPCGRIVQPFQWLAFTFPLNMTGQPAATVPAGFTRDGLPVGLQIIGRHLDDALVLRASAAFEQARPWADQWPALLAEKGL